MQILVITGSYPPKICGIADYTARLGEALSDGGYDICILTSQPDAQAKWPIESVSGWNLRDMRRVLNVIKSRKPDVALIQYQRGIYSDSPWLCFLPALIRLLTRTRVVTTFHDLNGPSSWRKLQRLGVIFAMLGSHRVVVCSKKQLTAVKRIPLVRRRASLIPVGSTIMQQDWLGYTNPLRAACFGFVWRNRGIEEVIEACARVQKSGIPIGLTFVGDIVDRDYAEELVGYASAAGLPPESLEFTGALSEDKVSALLAGSTMAVLPFPTGVSTGRSTFVTCASIGMPVVTTCCPDNWPEELAADPPAVLSYSPGDVASLAQHIQSVCTDQPLGLQLSASIRTSAQNWSWTSIAQQYSQAMDGKRGTRS